MTRLPSRAAVLAAWTASLGWAFLHSTFLVLLALLFDFGVACLGSIFLPSRVWEGTASTRSTASGLENVMKPNPLLRCVIGSFITKTSVTFPNWPKYSLSFSGVVCQDRPPTNNLPGAESELGVERPLEPPWDTVSPFTTPLGGIPLRCS